MHKTYASALIRVVALVGAAGPIAGYCNDVADFKALAERSVSVEGTVYSLSCHNHGQYWYEFHYDGKRHIGQNDPLAPPYCSDVHVGSKVIVHVDPQNPKVHTLSSPIHAYERRRGFHVPLWAIPIVGFALYSAHLIWRGTQPPKS
jgi:hypothetical protein